MSRKAKDLSAPKAPRKNAAKPKAVAERFAVGSPERAEARGALSELSAKLSAPTIKRRFHEPYGRDCWDVHYEVNGETAVDKGFLSAEAAQAHADSLA